MFSDTFKRAGAVVCLVLALAWMGHAQFGSYSHDLPFMGVDASSGLAVPSNDLVIWHKPESLSGTNGQRIKLWADSSPAGDHAANTNTSLVGALITNNLVAGFPALKFGGSGAFVYHTNGTSHDILKSKTGGTLFTLWRPGPDGTWNPSFYISQGDFVNQARFYIATLGKLVRFWMADTDARSESVLQYDLGITNWHLATYVANFTNGQNHIYTNGVLRATETVAAHTNGTSATASLYMSLGYGPSAAFEGYYAEVIFYSYPLTTNDLTTVHNYFKAKYGLW